MNSALIQQPEARRIRYGRQGYGDRLMGLQLADAQVGAVEEAASVVISLTAGVAPGDGGKGEHAVQPVCRGCRRVECSRIPGIAGSALQNQAQGRARPDFGLEIGVEGRASGTASRARGSRGA